MRTSCFPAARTLHAQQHELQRRDLPAAHLERPTRLRLASEVSIRSRRRRESSPQSTFHVRCAPRLDKFRTAKLSPVRNRDMSCKSATRKKTLAESEPVQVPGTCDRTRVSSRRPRLIHCTSRKTRALEFATVQSSP